MSLGVIPNSDELKESSKNAKQRASICWLLSKAFNNQIPEQLSEPFYTDHDGNLHLKPQIVVGLGNASLYCQVLANIYCDPNYQNLNHWSILQTLCRKGISVFEEHSGVAPLTETLLIQQNPLRINAHMIVIESLMILYAKEITSGDRIQSVVTRLSLGATPDNLSSDQLLLHWLSHAMAALKHRLQKKLELEELYDNKNRIKIPDIPTPVHDFASLCDGVCLAYLIAFYCPKILPWHQVRISYLPTIEDSLHNLSLVEKFSQHHLPYSIFHLLSEDVISLREHLKTNLVLLLADMFTLFEIHPAECVDYPELETSPGNQSENFKANIHGISYRRGLTFQSVQPIPDLRCGSNLVSPVAEQSCSLSFQGKRSGSATNVVTQHTSYAKNTSLSPENEFTVHKSKGITTLFQTKESSPGSSRHYKDKGKNDIKNDEKADKPAGRPSNWEDQRRPSFAGRRSRKNSFSEDSQLTIENFGGSQEQLNTIGMSFDQRSLDREKKPHETSFASIEMTLPARSSIADARGSLQIGYGDDDDFLIKDREKPVLKSQHSNASSSNSNINMQEEKKKMPPLSSITPTTTTWRQQSLNLNQLNEICDINQPYIDESKLSSVRLKLEEKRRHIEKEKRKIEAQMSKQLQKVGKAAFLQAINIKDKPDPSQMRDNDSHANEKHIQSQDVLDSESLGSKTLEREQNNNLSLEQYHQSIAMMNSDLHDIQEDIQKLAEQQNQIQVQTMQAQQLLQAQQIASILNNQYSSQQNIAGLYHPVQQPDSNPQLSLKSQAPQYVNEQIHDIQKLMPSQGSPRIIEDQYTSTPSKYLNQEQQLNIVKYVQDTNHCRDQYETQRNQFFLHGDSSASSPQTSSRRTWLQKGQQTMSKPEMSSWSQQSAHKQAESLSWNLMPSQKSKSNLGGFILHENGKKQNEDDAHALFPVMHASQREPSSKINQVDDTMTPQSISFIGDEDGNDDIAMNFNDNKRDNRSSLQQRHQNDINNVEISLGKFNITSGSKTYRIPSPTIKNHPGISPNSFHSVESQNGSEKQKGFYISFDNETQPKRPKPPLRTKRSPKKSFDNLNNFACDDEDDHEISVRKFQAFDKHKENDHLMRTFDDSNDYKIIKNPTKSNDNKVLLVEANEKNFDPEQMDEMQRKKEKIMLLSLQRRQQQEEVKVRKEIAAVQRKEKDQMKEEEKARKKEEQLARRTQILEQHRLKKAIEEAEREGKVLDRATAELITKQQQMFSTQPKMRRLGTQRPRPKTIHVETNSSFDMNQLEKKASNSNLTGIPSNTMRRDYYRGSQDSLSTKEPQGNERGRTLNRLSSVAKYGGAGANFRGRKSNSLMNLCGDSDSGLGRATPPRRAPSPGMGSRTSSGKHLPSPSGPGSLPHPNLMIKRRGVGYDDGASDISSTHSSIFGDYSGPRLYKQPAAKSNRGILLNAVEYCVFPGVVNREAKQKVLEKIARSEAKHFLILFRDAGCQFRALYSFDPETEAIIKLYGTGPSHVYDVMFDKFFKYNSGGKCFAQVHTKHLTVTCDAFSIHNSLWQGKKTSHLPNKKDMALVI
ncbi:CLUMA_CG020974, isoform B [Clunio marinus]|uniref:CLUMA_CG020974, isoform B n=1 Tax=Clunio marinus TaxID=568069 RepID=A0A1J1J8G5_9DIPT|nr:CLUMA_CG020974, isoform B [Clunio marinus]